MVRLCVQRVKSASQQPTLNPFPRGVGSKNPFQQPENASFDGKMPSQAGILTHFDYCLSCHNTNLAVEVILWLLGITKN